MIKRGTAVVAVTAAIAAGTALVAPTASASPHTIGPVTENCGFASCSYYLSRSATKDLYAKSTVAGGAGAAFGGLMCLTLGFFPPAAAACGAVVAVDGAWILQELADAATQHGSKGACFKMTEFAPTITGVYFSTNNGKFCKD
jgi:hypothetical protein